MANLDGMTETELKAFYFSKRFDADGTTRDLAWYAGSAWRARKARRAGRINHALKLEERCERIYSRLPVSVRW